MPTERQRGTAAKPDEVGEDEVGQIVRRLERELGDAVTSDIITLCVTEVFHQWDDAPIRSFVPILAARQARQRLGPLPR